MSTKLTPEVLWAQRSSSSDPTRNHVFLTISTPDVPKDSMKLDLQPTYLEFTGHSNSKKADYHVKLELYAEIDPKESKVHHTDRDLELVLRKKELGEEYWPRLTKEKQKLHFLKTDFDKWVDEDEQDVNADDDDYMKHMNDMNGGFGGIDFSKLGAGGAGAMGGMEGMGGAGMGGGDDSDDDLPDEEEEDASKEDVEKLLKDLGASKKGAAADDDDDDMPELEETDKGKGKIQEL